MFAGVYFGGSYFAGITGPVAVSAFPAGIISIVGIYRQSISITVVYPFP